MQGRVDAIEWFHSIDFGGGVRSKGHSELAYGPEVLPTLGGCSVLDVGAWDGYYSFLAERRGANRVVALDHYAWGVDFAARGDYWNRCIAAGELPDLSRDTTEFWRPDLPGRRGFELARELLDSKVEAEVADFMTADLDALGRFDVVLFLGVLYHMKEPLTALERLRALTGTVAAIETEAIHVHGSDGASLVHFQPASAVGTDFGNWYVPTIEALCGMCRAAGFSRVDVILGPPAPTTAMPRAAAWRARATHRHRAGAPRAPASAPTQHYRALVHAYV